MGIPKADSPLSRRHSIQSRVPWLQQKPQFLLVPQETAV